MTTISAFAERLTALRENKGKKRQDVADDIQISRASLEYYEKGKRKPDIEVLLKLADYYNVTCDYLLKGVKTENVSINEVTGLSDKAIEELENNKKYNIEGLSNFETGNFEILNKFIETGAIFKVCEYVDSFYSAVKYQQEVYKDILNMLENDGFPDTEEYCRIDAAEERIDVCLFRLQEINKKFTKDIFKEIIRDTEKIKSKVREIRISIEVEAYNKYLELLTKDGE